MKIKLQTKEVVDFLKTNSKEIIIDGVPWLYMPYWFIPTNEPDVFDMVSPNRLPAKVVEEIKNQRDAIKNRKSTATQPDHD